MYLQSSETSGWSSEPSTSETKMIRLDQIRLCCIANLPRTNEFDAGTWTIWNRAVESQRRKGGKSLKLGKNKKSQI